MANVGKLTQKNIKYGIVKNVNDEIITGYNELSNVDVGAIVGGITQRKGFTFSDILGFTKGTSLNRYNHITTASIGEDKLSNYITDGNTNLGIVYTFDKTINMINFDFIMRKTGTLPSVNLMFNIYEYNLALNIIGEKVGYTGNVATSTLFDNLRSFQFTCYDNLAVNGLKLERGKSYLFKLVSFSGIDTTNDIMFNAYATEDSNFNVTETVIPTRPSIFDKGLSVALLRIGYTKYIQSILPEYTTGIINEKDNYYISRLNNPSASSFGFGVVDKYVDGVKTEDILKNSSVTFPACYYGFRIFDRVHTYGIGLGGQLTNKMVNTTDYRMVKKAKTDTDYMAVTGETNATLTGTAIMSNVTKTTQLIRGEYEYLIEFIGNDGRAYKNAITVKLPPAINTPLVWGQTNNITINIPTLPKNDKSYYSFIKLYRRQIAYFGDTGLAYAPQILTPDAPYMFVTNLDNTNFDTVNSVWYYTDNARSISQTTLEEKEYYYPRPADMCLYKDKIIALGDKEYPNYIFPAREYTDDFYFTDVMQVTFPEGDEYFTACETLNDDCFAFSKHGTWRIRQISTTAPLFQIQQVSDKLGCITTSKGIAKAFGKLFVLTADGFCEFDGYVFKPIDTQLNNVLKPNFTDRLIQTGGTPSLSVGHVDSFLIQSVYNNIRESIILFIPAESGFSNGVMYEYSLKTGEFYTVEDTGAKGIWKNDKENRAGFYTDNNVYEFDKVYTYDYLTDSVTGTVINSVIDMNSIDFEENTQVKTLRLFGKGLCTVEIYMDKELIPTATFTDIEINEDETHCIELPLGWNGQFYRHKIIIDKYTDFQLNGFQVVYYNDGIKKFKTVG